MYEQPTGIQWNNSNSPDYGVVQYGSDRQLVVMFYRKAVHNPVKSMQHGAPVSDDVDYVKMHPPGERLNIIDRPVVDNDKARFPHQWKAYQGGRSQETDGIPIELLFPAHPSIGVNLRSAGVHTVEQCANMSSTAIETIGMGAQEYVNRARQYLDIAGGGRAYHNVTKEVEDLRRVNSRLQDELAQLRAQLDIITSQMVVGRHLVPDAMVPKPAYLPREAAQVTEGDLIQAQRQAALLRQGSQEPTHDKMADLPKAGFNNPWAGNRGNSEVQ